METNCLSDMIALTETMQRVKRTEQALTQLPMTVRDHNRLTKERARHEREALRLCTVLGVELLRSAPRR